MIFLPLLLIYSIFFCKNLFIFLKLYIFVYTMRAYEKFDLIFHLVYYDLEEMNFHQLN